MIRNPFGTDGAEFNEITSAQRVGSRIRKIRTAMGMSQAELGELVGLNADRIQKYENGARKPKLPLLKKIAEALGVETLALSDPAIDYEISAMYALFEMEDHYDLKVSKVNNQLILLFGNGYSYTGGMNSLLNEWEKECRMIAVEMEKAPTKEERAAVLMEYNKWKWTFPRALTDRNDSELKELRKAKIQEQIDLLQQELSGLED